MRLGDGAILIDSGPRDPAAWGENMQAMHVYSPIRTRTHARAAAAGAHDHRRRRFDTPWARGYYARDLDGFLWGFSTYKPIHEQRAAQPAREVSEIERRRPHEVCGRRAERGSIGSSH